jgi:hypothetical protein
MGTLVIGLGRPKDEEESADTDTEDAPEGDGDAKEVMSSAYDDLTKAMDKGDRKAGMAALRDFVRACSYEEE